MRIGFFTPFHLKEKKDLSMLYYHRRLRKQLAWIFHSKGHELVGLGTVDLDSTGSLPAKIAYPEFEKIIDLRQKTSTGIVDPTRLIIHYAQDTGIQLLVRLGQDVIVTDLEKACEQILRTPEDTLVGASDTCNDIRGHLKRIGLVQEEGRYKFVQGNWLQAYLEVWNRSYLKIPSFIKHYCDDSLFSYLHEKHFNGKLQFTEGNKIIHKHKRDESASYFNQLLHEPLLEPPRPGLNLLVLYRIHAKSADEAQLKGRFLKLFLDAYRRFCENYKVPGKFFLISDNTAESEEMSFSSQLNSTTENLISIKSNKQSESLVGGAPCSSKHYTLYITSMQLVEKNSDRQSIIFFVEDDYLFRFEALAKVAEFLADHPNDFVAPMDHPDRYYEKQRAKELTDHYAPYRLEVLWEQNHHWRTCISTCHTFATTLKALELNSQFLLKADRQRGDHTMWCDIWRHGRSKVWSPMPGLASHRKGPHLEDWDWDGYFNNSEAVAKSS